MAKFPFVWLGSGRAARRQVPRKGKLLDHAARSGLPVPSGGILLNDFYQICLTEGIAKLEGDAVKIPDPIWLQQVLFRDVRFPPLEGPVAIRSAAELNIDQTNRKVGARLNIDLSNPEQLASGIGSIWSSLCAHSATPAHDILVMEMVTVETAGEALVYADHDRDQIQLIMEGQEEKFVAFELEQIGSFQRAAADIPAYAQRLQKLLRGFRRSFDKEEWRLDWADDGEICWIIQIY